MKVVLLALLALAVVGGLILAILPPARPAVHERLTAERMRGLLEMLYYRGYEGGMLFLEVRGDERFLQLRKQIRVEGGVSLRCDFPMLPWSEPYFAGVKDYLDSVGVSYRDSTGAGGYPMMGEPPSRFLAISLGQDVSDAERFVDHVLRKVFGVDPSSQVLGTVENVSPLNTKIGFDDRP